MMLHRHFENLEKPEEKQAPVKEPAVTESPRENVSKAPEKKSERTKKR